MPKTPTSTRDALILAAAVEFDTVGYEQTNTNEIARRAGYAPQTFYRHFKDKLAIFIAVYERWTVSELGVIAGAESADDLARMTLEHHAATKLFRRTLRDLTVRNPDVAAARAASRRRQLEAVCRRAPAFADQPVAAQIAGLLVFERLCDAVIEGEFERLGAERDDAVRVLSELARAFNA